MTRDEMVQGVITALKTIKKADGFSQDINDNVFDWLDRPIAEEEYPAIVVSDPTSINEQKQTNQHRLTLFIDLYMIGTATQLRAFAGDVIKVMYSLESTINCLISYKSSEHKHQQSDMKYFAAALEFEGLYHTSKGEQ